MYCPSCDKSYGAVHSRCPECHSWLKVSAPSGGRKNAKTGTAAAASPPAPPAREQSSVSTMDRSDDDLGSSFGGDDNGGWADPAPSSPSSNWGGGDDDWNSGGLGAAAAAAPSSEGWGGSAAASPQPGSGSSWSGKEGSEPYGWGGEPASPAASAAAPATPARSNNGGWADSGTQDGWGGGAGASSQGPAAKEQQDGWLGGGGGHDPGPRAGASSSSSSGWLANSGGVDSEASPGRGWLGDGPAEDAPRKQSGGGGWLGDSSDAGGPSMTEMVDHAISVEEADDFVDDSWVDEEIRDNEFDDLEIPEYAPPAPEVGGAFLKMLLVAVLVLLVGGGIMFAKNDSKSPEETAQEETLKQLEFGRATVAGGKKDLEAGKPGLAVPQFQEALVALSDGKAPQDEIYETEVLLGRALMADGEYKEAYKHWASLKESGQEKYKAEAQSGIDETSRQLRIVANGYLDEAKKYAAKNEITSVKRLGRDALDLYEEYGGSRAQMGDAHGVIGRGHLNGREYAPAKDEFKQAVALAPSLGYQKYLNQASQALAPAQYVPPVETYQRQQPVRQSSGPKPSFTLGQPQYQKSSGGRRGGGRRTSNSGNGGGGNAAPAPAAPAKTMKEIPIYRPTQRAGSSGERKGSKGVLKTY